MRRTEPAGKVLVLKAARRWFLRDVVILFTFCVVGCDAGVAPLARAPHEEVARGVAGAVPLGERLVSGRWIKDLGEGPSREQYVYTFGAGGVYTSKLMTDRGTPTMTGRWRLERGADGLDHLRLSDQQGGKDYYWLSEDSVVRLDNATGGLVVSGSGYAGEQHLRHAP